MIQFSNNKNKTNSKLNRYNHIIQMLTLSYISRFVKGKVKNYKGISKILLVAFDRQKMSYQNLSGQFLYII